MTFSSGLLLVGTNARADTVTIMSATLPTERLVSAVWDGTSVYMFGGWTDGVWKNEILRYNPATDMVTTMSATLPTARTDMSAVWDGTNAYLFGGWSTSGYLNQIVRYNPATNTVTAMSATLPTGRYDTSAVWDGTNAYIFGGRSSSGVLNQIVRYNPATNTVTTMSATLPSGRDVTSAVWDGTNAYIFGGWGGSNALNQIVRYNPSTNTVTTMSATLPTARFYTSAVWDGTNAYVFGGQSNSSPTNQIVRYNPGTNTVTTMSATLPTARYRTSAVWDGSNAYIITGHDCCSGIINQIVRYNPATPTVPRNLTAARGPDAGQITLNWQAPADSGSSPITNYRIYRSSFNGGFQTQIAEVGNVLTFTDTGLPTNATWYYRVTAVNAAGESPKGNTASATTPSTPSVPRNLQAQTDRDFGQVTLTWQAPLNDGGFPVTNYRVYSGTTSGGPYTQIAQTGSIFTFTDTGLPMNATRYYRVTAVNSLGEGPQSNEANATTPPSAPRNLQVQIHLDPSQVTLTWEAPLRNGGVPISNYRIYRGISSGGETFLAQVGNILTYTDSTCPFGNICYYTVSAANTVFEGPQSNEVSALSTTFVAAYDFESGPQGWSSWSYSSEWEWGTPTYGPPGAHSGVSAWGTDLDGTYENYADGSLYSPYIQLPSSSPIILSWWQYFRSASNDFGYVDVSENGGPWTTLAIFTGPASPTWAQQTVDLSAYAGSTIEVRYHFVSDSILVDEGWYVDDVSFWTPGDS